VAVVPGNAPEGPVLFQLVENFVQQVGKGVLKLLILDRGFVDGPNLTRCKKEWDIDVLLPVKKNMDLWADAWALGQRTAWQPCSPPPAPPAPAIPVHRPEAIARRERQRQKTLAARKAQAPSPPPSETLLRTEYCPIQGCRSCSDCQVPINVLLLRDCYADGHQDQWALMTTAPLVPPEQPKEQYHWRVKIEERHRLLKCFYDFSDFHSRCFNVIVAQVIFILLGYTLRQWQLWHLHQQQLAGHTPALLEHSLNLHREYVVIYHQHAYAQMPLVSFVRELLEMNEAARAKALVKIRHLEESLLAPMQNLRPP
jgi:hypothetical protein